MDFWTTYSPYVCLGLATSLAVGAYFFTRLQGQVDKQAIDQKGLDKNFENATLALRTDFSNQISIVRNDSTHQLNELRENLSAHRLHVAETYVTNDGLTKAVSNLNTAIERLIKAVENSTRETRDGLTEIHRRVDLKADK